MLVPDGTLYLSHTQTSICELGIHTANLRQLLVTSDIETLQVYENLLTNRKIPRQTTSVDGNDDSAGCILHAHLVVDIATDIIARHYRLDHHVLLNQLVAIVAVDNRSKLGLQICYADHILLPQAVVAPWRCRHLLGQVWVSITVAHTRPQGQCQECQCYEFYLFHCSFFLL